MFDYYLYLNSENYWLSIVVWNLQASGNAVLYCEDIGTLSWASSLLVVFFDQKSLAPGLT